MTDVKLTIQDSNEDTYTKTYNVNWLDSVTTLEAAARNVATAYGQCSNDTVIKIETITTKEVTIDG